MNRTVRLRVTAVIERQCNYAVSKYLLYDDTFISAQQRFRLQFFDIMQIHRNVETT